MRLSRSVMEAERSWINRGANKQFKLRPGGERLQDEIETFMDHARARKEEIPPPARCPILVFGPRPSIRRWDRQPIHGFAGIPERPFRGFIAEQGRAIGMLDAEIRALEPVRLERHGAALLQGEKPLRFCRIMKKNMGRIDVKHPDAIGT